MDITTLIILVLSVPTLILLVLFSVFAMFAYKKEERTLKFWFALVSLCILWPLLVWYAASAGFDKNEE